MAGDNVAGKPADKAAENALDPNVQAGLAAESWTNQLINTFPYIDKDKDGFISENEMEVFPGGEARQKFLDNYEAMQMPASFNTSMARTFGGKEGVALSDLEEIKARAKTIPLELRLNSEVESVFARNFSGHELRHGRFRHLSSSIGLKPDDKQVFDYVEKNWRSYKKDIGNQLNHDEAIIPRDLPQKVKEQNARLEERFRIVRQLAK